MSKNKKQAEDLNALVCEDVVLQFRPDLRRIKLQYFSKWIESRLVHYCDGMEDDILTGLVQNSLLEAQQRAGDLDSSGGLDGRELQLLLGSFVGEVSAQRFIGELWNLMKSAEEGDLNGVPPELATSKADAELEAFKIIHRVKEDRREHRDRRDYREEHREGRRDSRRESSRHGHGKYASSSRYSRSRSRHSHSHGHGSRYRSRSRSRTRSRPSYHQERSYFEDRRRQREDDSLRHSRYSRSRPHSPSASPPRTHSHRHPAPSPSRSRSRSRSRSHSPPRLNSPEVSAEMAEALKQRALQAARQMGTFK